MIYLLQPFYIDDSRILCICVRGSHGSHDIRNTEKVPDLEEN